MELAISNGMSLDINNTLKNEQQKFLNTTLGSCINNAIDIGLRAVLPDLIEDEFINIKDAILESGFKAGIEEAIKAAMNFGKSAIRYSNWKV